MIKIRWNESTHNLHMLNCWTCSTWVVELIVNVNSTRLHELLFVPVDEDGWTVKLVESREWTSDAACWKHDTVTSLPQRWAAADDDDDDAH